MIVFDFIPHDYKFATGCREHAITVDPTQQYNIIHTGILCANDKSKKEKKQKINKEKRNNFNRIENKKKKK